MTFRERLMLACTGLLITACAIVFVRYGTYQFLVRDFGWDDAWTQAIFSDQKKLQHWKAPRRLPDDEIPVDWAGKYPFPELAPGPSQAQDALLLQMEQQFHEQQSVFDAWTNRNFFSYMKFIEAMQMYRNIIGWNIAMIDPANNVVQLPDGYLFGLSDALDQGQRIDATLRLADFCRSRGVHFIVCLAPWKVPRSSPYAGTLDFSNQNADAYLSGLRAHDIDCIDLRDNLAETGLPYSKLFFRTDHHWTPDTARWAVTQLAKHLNNLYGYQADLSLLEPSRFREEKYPASFLGSFGSKVTLARTAPEDFSLYFPESPTAFHISIPSMALERRGDFSVLYDQKQLDCDSLYDDYAYHAYAYGDRALISIHNERRMDGKKLLLLHDSFGASATPFLALCTESLDTIDPRYFLGSLQTYIEREHPDTVVLLYDAIEFSLDAHIPTPRSPFDLR